MYTLEMIEAHYSDWEKRDTIEKRFADAYVDCLEYTKAAILAGYSEAKRDHAIKTNLQHVFVLRRIVRGLEESARARRHSAGIEYLARHHATLCAKRDRVLLEPSHSPERFPGYVYFFRAENGLVKIGKASCVAQRLEVIQVSSPCEVICLFSIPCEDPVWLEARYHQRFQKKRVRGEWFALTEDDLQTIQSQPDVTPAPPAAPKVRVLHRGSDYYQALGRKGGARVQTLIRKGREAENA